MIALADITLGVLAGGRASRLQGADKTALRFAGESLLQRTLGAFPDNYGERLLSYNREADPAWPATLRVVADRRTDFPGPLAAFEALADACRTPWLLTVPVDCREIPRSLAAELAGNVGLDGVVIRDGDGLQPLVGLWRVATLAAAATTAISAGQLAAHTMIERLDVRIHDISPARLGNLNTPADFATP